VRLSSWKSDIAINCQLYEADTENVFNRIEVSGIDNEWVASTYQRLMDCINKWQNQNSVFKRYSYIFTFLIMASGLWCLLAVVSGLIKFFSGNQFFGIYTWLPLVVSLGLTTVFAYPIKASYVDGLWPNIEFVPYLKHLNNKERKRSRLRTIMFVVFIPTLITLIVGLAMR
jgi:nitrate reductase NapE component